MVKVHKRLPQKNARGNENTARGNHKKSTNLKIFFVLKQNSLSRQTDEFDKVTEEIVLCEYIILIPAITY